MKKYYRPIVLGKLFNVPILLYPSGMLISLVWIYAFFNLFSKYNWPLGVQIIGALAVPFIIFGSITAHEFSHILTAKKYGIGTRRVDLFVFGGCALIEGEPKSPLENFW